MTEIPEHLMKRANEARKKADADAAMRNGLDVPNGEVSSRSAVPEHLLKRSRAAKGKAEAPSSIPEFDLRPLRERASTSAHELNVARMVILDELQSNCTTSNLIKVINSVAIDRNISQLELVRYIQTPLQNHNFSTEVEQDRAMRKFRTALYRAYNKGSNYGELEKIPEKNLSASYFVRAYKERYYTMKLDDIPLEYSEEAFINSALRDLDSAKYSYSKSALERIRSGLELQLELIRENQDTDGVGYTKQQRIEKAREALEDTHGTEVMRDSIDGRDSDNDIFGTSDILDLVTPNACNLFSVAIRKATLDKLEKGVEDESNRHEIKTIEFSERGELVAVPTSKEVVVSPIFSDIDKPYSLVSWIEEPDKHYEKRRFLRDKELPFTREHIEFAVISYGIQIKTAFDRKVMVPLLKSIETSAGCNVVFPNGHELNDEYHNKKEILKGIDDIMTGDQGKRLFGADEKINAFLSVLEQNGAEGSESDPYLEIAKRYLVGDGEAVKTIQDKVVDLAVRYREDSLKKTSEDKTIIKDENGRDISRVVLQEITDKIGVREDEHPADIIVTSEEPITDSENGLKKHKFIIRLSYSKKRFGKLAHNQPRFEIVIDELDRVEVGFYGDNYSTTTPATENQLQSLVKYFN